MESDKLEERILTWSVFVRSHPKWEQEMLESYIRQSGKEHVILAYLTYLAIGYFMDGKPLSDQMFDYLDRAWKQGLGAGRDLPFCDAETSFHEAAAF